MSLRPIEISLRGPFPGTSLDRLLVALEPLETADEPRALHLDLSGLARIGAPALAVLLNSLRVADARGLIGDESRIVTPKNDLVRRWLERMDAIRLLASDAAPAEDFVRRDPHGFRPCQVFDDPDSADLLPEELSAALEEACKTDSASRQAAYFALDEITRNVIEHAESRVGGLALAQRAKKTGHFEVVIADRGVGIRSSLERNPTFAGLTDGQALAAAVTRGATSKAMTDRAGLGLFIVQTFLRVTGGAFVVRSGTALLEIGQETKVTENLPLLRGTMIVLRFTTAEPFGMETILRLVGSSGSPRPSPVGPRAVSHG